MDILDIVFGAFCFLCTFSLVVFWGSIAGKEFFRFFVKPLVALTVFIITFSLGIVLILKDVFVGVPTIMLFGMAMLLPLAYSFANWFSNTAVMPGAKRIKSERECAEAQAAEKQGRLDGAIELYKKELTGKDKEDGLINLKIGNLYSKKKDDELTAEYWQKALNGNSLTPEMYIATSVKLSNICLVKLHRKEEAEKILSNAVKRYPNLSDTKALKKRLKLMARGL